MITLKLFKLKYYKPFGFSSDQIAVFSTYRKD